MAIFLKLSIFVFVFVTCLLHCAAAKVSFVDHCASIAPYYSTPQRHTGVNSSVHRLTGFCYTAGVTKFLIRESKSGPLSRSQNSILFSFWYDGNIDEHGLYMVQGSLQFPKDSTYFLVGIQECCVDVTDSEVLRSFEMNGVWSESSGELCMVGSGSKYSEQGNLLTFHAVLKLHKLKSSSSLTSLITGTFESLVTSENEPNYFVQISISLLPSMNYDYTLVSNKSRSSYLNESNEVPSSSLKVGELCSVFSRAVPIRALHLRYSSHCDPGKNCSPLAVSYMLRIVSLKIVSLKIIECSDDSKRLRLLVDFAVSSINYHRPFDPTTTLVAEGSWDSSKNQLHVVACRFLDAGNSLSPGHVGDCSTKLTMRFPAIWTLGNSSCIVGEIWSNKPTTESGYFANITFDCGHTDTYVFPGQRYEYMKLDNATKLCRKRNQPDADDYKGNIFPNPYSYEMRLAISANSSTTGEVGWADFLLVSLGNRFFQPYWYLTENGTEVCHRAPMAAYVRNGYSDGRYNISYRINIRPVDEDWLPSGLYQLNAY